MRQIRTARAALTPLRTSLASWRAALTGLALIGLALMGTALLGAGLGACSQKNDEAAPQPVSSETTAPATAPSETPPTETLPPPRPESAPATEPETRKPSPPPDSPNANHAGDAAAAGDDVPAAAGESGPTPLHGVPGAVHPRIPPARPIQPPSPPPPPPPPPPPGDEAQPEKHEAAAAPDSKTEITVFYGTDRKLVSAGGVLKYSRAQTSTLYLGAARVSIPPKHQEGEIERPKWWKGEFAEDENKHVVFQGFSPLKQADWDAMVQADVAKSTEKQAFIFIHGFNTSFEDAALRTAQMAYDLKFDGAAMFYSWASDAELSPLAYNRDSTKADVTVPRLVQFLRLAQQRSGAKKIHIIAHSMGNKALINALARIAEKEKGLFSEIILCAPDIDRNVFFDLAQQFDQAGRHVTLYASANDKALKASEVWAGFPRVGDAGKGIVVVDPIDTVDASPVTTDLFGLDHSFYANVPDVLDDIGRLLRTGQPASTRPGLKPAKTANGRPYWVIE